MSNLPETSTFVDACGREWRLLITVASIERVKAATGVRLDKLLDEGCRPLADLLGDLPAFVNVLWHLSRRKVKELNLTEEEFAEGFAGDVLDSALLAFQRALADFSPSRARQILQGLASKAGEIQEKAMKKALTAIESVDADQLLSTLSSSATDSPDSAASIPAP